MDVYAEWVPVPHPPDDYHRRGMALVSEGMCPLGHGRLALGAHPSRYGWCHTCGIGYAAWRTGPDDMGMNVWYAGEMGAGPASVVGEMRLVHPDR